MSGSKMETVIGLSAVALTRFLMSKYQLNQEDAYRKLIGTELFKLLKDSETRLYLETNEYLCRACEKELNEGIEALYTFINEN